MLLTRWCPSSRGAICSSDRRVVKRHFTFVIPLFLFAAQVVVSLPGMTNQFARRTQQYGVAGSKVQFGFGVFLIVLFAVNQWLAVLKPFDKFARFERTKLQLLGERGNYLTDAYADKDFAIRANLMLAKRVAVNSSEPRRGNPEKTKVRLFPEVFDMVWSTPSVRFDGDLHLHLTTRQGVSGQAYRGRKIHLADLTVEDAAEYGLNPEQLRMTAPLKFVLSCPVYEVAGETLRPSKKVIGVVNFDSRQAGSEALVRDKRHLAALTERIMAFSEFASHLF